MRSRSLVRRAAGWTGIAAAFAAGTYAAYAAVTWARYGRATHGDSADEALLDRFMPRYEVAERHRIFVDAPAAITLAAAQDMDLTQSPIIRAIFRTRALVLGATPDDRLQPSGLLLQAQAMGWRVLAETTGREIVVGAVTKPWEPNVTFRGIEPAAFADFDEPDYVKIVWNLRAEPAGDTRSLFLTTTRAVATDAAARAKFRTYWAFLSPGIALIRWLSLGPMKRAAERRALALAGEF